MPGVQFMHRTDGDVYMGSLMDGAGIRAAIETRLWGDGGGGDKCLASL